MRMQILSSVNWREVKKHYLNRQTVHKKLLDLHKARAVRQFVELLLAISDPAGNYSADEHKLGRQILSRNANAHQRVFDLATQFIPLKAAFDVPKLVKAARLSYLQIGVGSEASCMLNPEVCWVVNTRTIWTHLVLKHRGNFEKADEELRLYRDADDTSEMAYRKWEAIHCELANNITMIADDGAQHARSVSVTPGQLRYLWADAIADWLYAYHHE